MKVSVKEISNRISDVYDFDFPCKPRTKASIKKAGNRTARRVITKNIIREALAA